MKSLRLLSASVFFLLCLVSFTAFTIAQSHTITATATNGTIIPSGSVLVANGGSQAFSFSANSGYHFDSLFVDGIHSDTVTGNTFNFVNVTVDHSIHVLFAPDTFTISATSSSGGSISPSGITSLTTGNSQSYTITPNTGYHIDSVVVDGVNQGSITSYDFTSVAANHTIAAYFSINTYTVTASAGSNGSISPSGNVVVQHGNNQRFTFAANTGYHVDTVKVDGIPVDSLVGYTFSNVTGNHTITVSFAINQYTITASASSGGTISPSGPVVVNHGNNRAFTITPNTGYHIDSVVVDGANQGAVGSYTFSNVTSNHTISAYFSINVYTITASAGSNGTISPSGSVGVNHGGSQTFSFTPSTGYHVDSLIVDGVNQNAASSYSFTNVTSNRTIRVTFAINTYTLAINATNGSVTKNPNQSTYNHGTSVQLTAVPNTGYHFTSWSGAASGSTNPTTVVMDSNKTVTASFAINTYNITSSAGANGTITPSGTTVVNHGSGQSYTITPNAGYHIDSVIVDGSPVAATSPYSFTNVTASHTIRVVFALNQYTITASAGANGSISPSGAVSVNHGGNQSFTISANTGYHIDSVVVDGTNQGAISNYSFTNVTAAHTIAAYFSINVYTIAASAGANGSISPSGNVSVNHGSNQSFTVTPSTGYHVDSLIVDGVNQGTSGNYTFTNVTAPHTIRAVFAINQYTLNVNTVGSGSVAKNPNQATYAHGTSVQLTATPGTGYSFTGWSGDASGSSNPTTVAMSADKSVTATFTINTYTITATAGANGTISPSGSVNVTHGSDTTFTFTPSTGYHVDSVIVDGSMIGSPSSYTFTNVVAARAIRVTFAINQYTITSSINGNGTISPSGAVLVNHGGNRSYTIGANTGYHIDSVLVDGVDQGPISSYNFTNVTSNHTIAAYTSINQYTITATAGANGTISPSGAVGVSHGGFKTFNFTPSTGYHIDSVVVDGVSLPVASSYTFTSVTADHTIRVTFAINQFTITASAGANGAISPSGSVTVNYGSNQTFNFTPSTGYHVADILVDGISVGAAPSYQFTNVTSNRTISVSFAINQYTITATADTGGTISPSGSVLVNHGNNRAFTITANTGYHLDSVVVDGVNLGAITSHMFTSVTGGHSINAYFSINQYTISASAGSNGSISPSGLVSVNHGGSQAFTITPTTGYHIADVTVDGSSVGAVGSYTFTNVTSNRTIVATFAINGYTITATAGSGGQISPSGSVGIDHGNDTSFTITPNTGYHIDSVIVDGVNQGTVGSYTFTNVTTGHTIRAVFAINQYAITATAGANGAISPSGSIAVSHGANQTFNFTPSTGYHVDSVFVDGGYVGNNSSHTFTSVTTSHSIHVTFAINQYSITATAGANGSVSPSGATTINHGSNQTFNFIPASGYHVDSVIVDGSLVGSSTSHTFTNVTANHTLRVTFAINQYTIVASAGANGTISPSGSVGASHGGSQSFTITPNTGYHIADVVVDGSSVGAVATYNFTNITGNHTIAATFAINAYTLTVSATNGSVTKNPDQATYDHGTSVQLIPVANTGYHFVNWSGDATGSTDPLSVTMDSSKNIIANFAIDTYTITATAGANGSISPSGITNLNHGDNQSYTITPSTGYHIDSVFVDGINVGTSANYDFINVTANHTIRAVFAINQYTIVATAGSNGSITPSGNVTVSHGSDQSFSITPNTGYHIDSVVVDGVNQGAVSSYQFTNVTVNHSISAHFSINQYTIAASAGSNGSISPAGVVSLNHGQSQSFTITPDTGYHVADVLVDGNSVGAVTSYQFTSVTGSHTIAATFAINGYTITATANNGGQISPSGVVHITHGSDTSFTISANTGYHIDSVIVDGVNQGPVASYSFTNVTSTGHTIRAVFAINTYTLNTNSTNGSIAKNPDQTAYDHGSTVELTATPDIGYTFTGWTGDTSGFANPLTVTMDGNKSVSANFSLNTYSISASASSGGSISPSGSVPISHGADQSFTITPSVGYHITDVLVDSVSVGAVSSYAFTNVTSNRTIQALFAIDQFAITATAGTNGSIAPLGSAIVDYGANQTFIFTPSTGYHVDSVFVDGSYVGSASSHTFSNVTTNHSVHVTFAIDQFSIVASSGANGSISPSGTVGTTYGSNVAFTFTPVIGYHVDSVIVDGTAQPVASSYTFNAVSANHTIRVTFAIDRFTITSSGGSNGSISPAGSTVVDYEGSQLYTITPATGYHVDSLIVDGVSVVAAASYEFTDVVSNHTIRATFAINQYTVVSSAGPNGTINLSGTMVVNHGDSRMFTFTPSTGYHVDSIIVDGSYVGNTNSYTLSNITANHTLHVTFAIDQSVIAASAGANGSISPSGNVNVNYGANRTFIFTPATGYHIDSVIVDGSYAGNGSSYTFFSVLTDHTIRVTFAIDQFTITSSAGSNGSISPLGATTVNYGSSQLYTITPNPGYHVASLFVDDLTVDSTTSYTFSNITASHTIQATFALNSYTIAATAVGNGTVAPSGSIAVAHGGSQSFTFTPAAGHHVDSVIVDGVNVNSPSGYTFSNIIDNHSLRVVFAINQYAIVSSAGANGTISPAGTTNVPHSGSQTYTLTPATGYHVDSLIVDGVNAGSLVTYTFANVTAPHSIRAVFAINQYTIVSTATGNGTITPSGSTTVNHGASQSYTITPATGYHIDSVLVDGAFVGAIANYSFTNVVANHTITVKFAINAYTIAASAGANGSVSPSGSMGVSHGSNQIFTFTPNTGYHVDSLIVDGVNQPAAASYTFTNVTANHTIRVTFAVNRYTIVASAGANGTISPSGTITLNHGANQTFTFTAATGYHIDSLIIDGVSQTPSASYQFAAISANHTVRVTFAINRYTISVVRVGTGTVTPGGSVTVAHGANQNFTFSPSAGNHIDSIIVDGVVQPLATSYQFNNVTTNHTLRIVFAINRYTITASAGFGGSITPSGSVLVNHGADRSFSITPSTGYHTDSVIIDGVNLGPMTGYTFPGVTTNHTISVFFSVNMYVLSVGTIGSGTVARLPNLASYIHGTSVQITATEDPDYTFIGWTGDATGTTNPLVITMDRTKSITARFVANASFDFKYRTFAAESIATERDNFGRLGKFIKRRADQAEVKLNLRIPRNVTGKLTLAFNMPFTGYLYQDASKSVVLDSIQNEKQKVIGPTIDSLSVPYLEGIGAEGRLVAVSAIWNRSPRPLRVLYSDPGHFIVNRPRLSMPNRINALAETFSDGGFESTGGLLVGIDKRKPIDSSRYYGWMLAPKYTDVLRTLADPQTGGQHTGNPRGFDRFDDGSRLVRAQRSLSPSKFNNGLLAEMTALKLNIAASALGVTPVGFGELLYDDGTDNPLNGLMVKEIAAVGDHEMTGSRIGIMQIFSDPETFNNLEATVRQINLAFEGTLDTISFSDTLQFAGTRKISDVSFLKPNAFVQPARIARIAAGDPQLPSGYALYQNYPNPFNPTTTIAFELPERALVTLKVYNSLGQEILTLLEREEFGEGTNEVIFNATELSSGMYFYRVVAEGLGDQIEGTRGDFYTDVKKMVLVK